MSLSINMTNAQKAHIKLNPVAADGDPAVVTDVVFSVIFGDVTLEVDADGMGCYIVSGSISDSAVSVEAKADDGSVLSDEVLVFVTDTTTAVSLGLVNDFIVNK